MENIEDDNEIETILIPEQDIFNMTVEEEEIEEIIDSEEEEITDENQQNEADENETEDNTEEVQQIGKSNESSQDKKPKQIKLYTPNFNMRNGEKVVVVRNKFGNLVAIRKSEFPEKPSNMTIKVGQNNINSAKVPTKAPHFRIIQQPPGTVADDTRKIPQIPQKAVKRPPSPIRSPQLMKISKVESVHIQMAAKEIRDKNLRFCCHLCKTVFENVNEYQEHTGLPLKKAIMSLCCGNCQCIFPKFAYSTAKHQCKESDADSQKQKYFCKRCKQVFAGIEKFDCHYKLFCAKEKILHCYICDMKFDNPYEVNRHITDIHSYKTTCRLCGQKIEQEIEQHIESCDMTYFNALTVGKFGCIVCQKTIRTIEELRKHTGIVNLSIESAFYGCNICSNIFTSKEFLKEHLKRGHTQVFKCDKGICSKVFIQKELLETHNFIKHKSEVSTCATCTQCQGEFKNGKELECHKIVSSLCHSPTIYKCKFCKEENFKHPYTVLKHLLKEHHATGQFCCNDCGVVYYPPVNRQSHKEECPKTLDQDYKTVRYLLKTKPL